MANYGLEFILFSLALLQLVINHSKYDGCEVENAGIHVFVMIVMGVFDDCVCSFLMGKKTAYFFFVISSRTLFGLDLERLV